MITATRRISFCAGHRVHRHESKCRNLHGHQYEAELTACGKTSPQDALGRVIDFSVLKERLGGWIDKQWDHGFIIDSADDEALTALRAVPGQKIYQMPENPTAENMAKHLLHDIAPLVLSDTAVEIVRVRLWETPNCYAEVSL